VNFFTVSGMAEQRVSPGAVSLRTAIFTCGGDLGDDQENEECDDQANDCAPFQQRREPRIIVHVPCNFLRRRTGQDGFFVVRH
jgi:hypothetical protein